MHVTDFKEIVDQSRGIQDIVQIAPTSLIRFTKETQIDLLRFLSEGAEIKDALRMARVTPAAYATWNKLAENFVEPFVSFILECEAAQGFFNMELIQVMRTRPMGAIELWKIRHPENPNDKGQNQINQTINLTFADQPSESRKAKIEANAQDIDYSQVYELPVKEPGE